MKEIMHNVHALLVLGLAAVSAAAVNAKDFDCRRLVAQTKSAADVCMQMFDLTKHAVVLLLLFGLWLVPPAVLLLLSVALVPAAEKGVWFCTYAFGTKAAEFKVASKFEARDNTLYESTIEPSEFDLRARYTILQNSSEAIVAAVSNADLDPIPATATVGAIIVMIDKRSGDFQFTGAMFGREAMQRPGHCINQPS